MRANSVGLPGLTAMPWKITSPRAATASITTSRSPTELPPPSTTTSAPAAASSAAAVASMVSGTGACRSATPPCRATSAATVNELTS